jgi:hypothetical protein
MRGLATRWVRTTKGDHNHAGGVGVGSGCDASHRRAGADYVPRMKGWGSTRPAPRRSPYLVV